MDPLYSVLLVLAAMAGVVLLFRLYVRRPRGLSERDPEGVRTVAVFAGDHAEFFADDRPDELFVGGRLFTMLCDGLSARGVIVSQRGTIPYAHRAECEILGKRYGLVLEHHDGLWIASLEWLPDSGATRRYLQLTHRLFSPPDSPALRQLLGTIDDWLKSQPAISVVRWHRKEKWLYEDTSDPNGKPVDG